jgi:hypothetical protein
LDNWTWGLALTIAIHATSVTFMVDVLHSIRVRLEIRGLRLPHVIAIVISAITVMGLLLAALHGIEAALWAALYLWLGALGSPETAILYSVDSMATRGASGFMLQPHWQMLGALEATDGVRHQHGLHIHGHVVLLPTPCASHTAKRLYQS